MIFNLELFFSGLFFFIKKNLYEMFIYLYIHVDTLNKELYFQGKQIFIRSHAIKRARERHIAYPDHVYAVLKTGKVKRFGKHGIKFIRRSKKGSVICLGEDIGSVIIIKTIERGN